MSTTVVIPITDDPGIDMYWHPWFSVTVDEDNAFDRPSTLELSVFENVISEFNWHGFQHELPTEQPGINSIEFDADSCREALSKHLEAAGLTSPDVRLASLAYMKE